MFCFFSIIKLTEENFPLLLFIVRFHIFAYSKMLEKTNLKKWFPKHRFKQGGGAFCFREHALPTGFMRYPGRRDLVVLRKIFGSRNHVLSTCFIWYSKSKLYMRLKCVALQRPAHLGLLQLLHWQPQPKLDQPVLMNSTTAGILSYFVAVITAAFSLKLEVEIVIMAWL